MNWLTQPLLQILMGLTFLFLVGLIYSYKHDILDKKAIHPSPKEDPQENRSLI